MMQQNVDSYTFRRVMGKFATGVTVLSFIHDDEPAGMTANAFMSLSVEPPMVLVSVRKQARFAADVKVGDMFGISFLREEHEHISSHFGGRPQPEKTANFVELAGAPVLEDALVQLAVRTNAIHEGGDHLVYIADVEGIKELEIGRPLLFFSGAYKQLHALDPANCWFDPVD